MTPGDIAIDSYPPTAPGGSQTSAAAAESMLPTLGTVRRIVYDAILAAGHDGLTQDELEAATSLPPNTARPRVWELCGKNRKAAQPAVVWDSGRTRKGSSGREMAVWVASQAWVGVPA